SHDLREPVRQLAIFNELLQKKYKDQLDGPALELIGHNINAAHRIEDLLKGLLEYTRAAGAPLVVSGECDANEVLRKTLEMFEEQIAETSARIERDPLPELPMHEVHLTQIFQNLIGNALKYRSENPPVIHISAQPAPTEWRLSVSDNGIGILPEYREKIFGLFQRLHGGDKYQGHGLGLSICQKIVQRYGGRIWVEAGPGGGSNFIFTIPRAQP
ncbi:MAG TPA: ATP-binding protein, partial [Bryobacteraceae bacterium]